MQVRWLHKAIQSLNSEAEYIAQENPTVTAELFEYVKAKVETLGDYPATGRPSRVPATREWVLTAIRTSSHTAW